MIDARAEASRLHALGWIPETMTEFHVSLLMLNGWTEQEFTQVLTELEGMVG